MRLQNKPASFGCNAIPALRSVPCRMPPPVGDDRYAREKGTSPRIVSISCIDKIAGAAGTIVISAFVLVRIEAAVHPVTPERLPAVRALVDVSRAGLPSPNVQTTRGNWRRVSFRRAARESALPA